MEELKIHLATYVAVNLLAGLVWWIATPGTLYWPIVLHVVWGVGLLIHIASARRRSHPGRVAKGRKPYRRGT